MANKFSLTFDVNANVAPFKAAIESMSQSFAKLKLPDNIGGKLGTELDNLSTKISKFEELASKPFHNMADVEKATKLFEEIELSFKKLAAESNRLKGLDSEKLIPKEVLTKIKTLNDLWKQLDANLAKKRKNSGIEQIAKDAKNAENALEKANNKVKEVQNSIDADKAKRNVLTTTIRQNAKQIKDLEQEQAGVEKNSEAWRNYNAEIKKLQQTNASLTTQRDKLNASLAGERETLKQNQQAQELAQQKVNELNQAYAQLEAELNALKSDNLEGFRRQVSELTGLPLDKVGTDIDSIRAQLDQFKADSVVNVVSSLENLRNQVPTIENHLINARQRLAEFNAEAKRANQSADSFNMLANRITYFFGATNAVLLMRRALTSAIATIKELDAAMTEMAVVTKLDIADYWEQLPEYAARANELGVAIKDVYESATLFYQQGLQTNQVVELSNQTLKMARIAGLDAAEATDRMTNALRGFNMELNETSAQKVADVYSQLAAMSASNVDEISTAMTKTASLAHNAGMEFETTAAFLSQIIETTRESAETAGTALKTVIARFQEMKKDPSEVGEVEGEIVDVNKIEGALRSVGVALRDTEGQFRNLDDVFLELASKWDSLDTNTQRYVATMAAGSRQQSRFIAMMSDYARTQELVAAANTAAGASDKQYEKTLDSLQSKLAKLKNAWNTFIMDITNNVLIKGTVDLLTNLINLLNRLTNSLPGIAGSLAKVGLAFGAFKIGGALVKRLIGEIAIITSTAKKAGVSAGVAFGDAYAKSAMPKIMRFNRMLFATTGTGANATKAFTLLDKSAKKMSASINTSTYATNLYNTQLKQGIMSETIAGKMKKRTAELNNLAAASTNTYQSQLHGLAIALGFSADQEALFNAMILDGIPSETAAVAIQSGLTTEMWEEAKARGINMSAMSAEDIVRIASNGTITVEIANLKALLLEKKKQIATSIINAGTMTAEVLAMSGIPVVSALATKALELLRAGTLKTSAAILLSLGMIGLALAVVALAILAIIGLVKLIKGVAQKIKAASPAGQLEEAKKAAEEASEATQRLNDQYNSLVDGLDDIQDKRAALDDMTEGTIEWRKAVGELNSQVMDLISQFPELEDFLEITNGVMSFSEENSKGQRMDEVILGYLEQKNNAQAGEMAAKREVLDSQNTVTLFPELADGKAKLLSWLTGGLFFNGEDKTVEDLEAARGISDEEKKRRTDAIEANNLQSQEYANTIAKYIAANVTYDENSNMSKSDFMGIAEGLANGENYDREYDKQVKFYEENYDANKAEYLYDYAKSMGYKNAVVKGNKITYENENGELVTVTPEEERVIARLASDAATASYKEILGKMPGDIAKAQKDLGYDKKTSTAVNKAFINGGQGLTNNDLEALKTANAEDIWNKLSKEVQDSFGEGDEGKNNFLNTFNDNVAKASEAYTKVNQVLEKFGVDEGFTSTITAGAATAISNEISDIVTVSGTEAGNTIMDLINGIEFESDDDAIQFGEVLASLDWSSVESIESLSDELLKLGISVPADQIDKLETQMILLGKATTSLDIEKVNEYVRGLSKIQLEIQGTDTRQFSDEQYQTLTESGAIESTEFVYNIETDTWDYLGDSTDAIVLAIQQQTNDLLGRNLANDLAVGNAVGKVLEENNYDLSDPEQAKAFIQATQKQAADEARRIAGEEEGLSGEEIEARAVAARAAVSPLTPKEMEAMAPEWFTEQAQALVVKNAERRDTEYLYEQSQHQNRVSQAQLNSTGANESALYAAIEQGDIDKINVYKEALILQANAAGVSSDKIDEFSKAIDENGKVQDKDAIKTLVNLTAHKKQVKEYAKDMKVIQNLKDEYEKMQTAGDKANTVQKMINNMGITGVKVDESNYEAFYNALDGISQGSAAAYKDLTELCSADWDISVTLDADNSVLIQTLGESSTAAEEVLKFLAAIGAVEVTYTEVDGKTQMHYWTQDESGNLRELTAENWSSWGIISIDQPDITTAHESLGGGGGGGSKVSYYEPDYDKYYNKERKLESMQRKRELNEIKLEILKSTGKATAQAIADYAATEITNLLNQNTMAKDLLTSRQQEMADYLKENSDLNQYANYDKANNIIQINWDLIESQRDTMTEEEGQKIDDYIAELERIHDDILSAEDTMLDTEKEVAAIRKQQKDEAQTVIERVRDAIYDTRQKEIDRLDEINNSIADTQSAVLDSIEKEINEQRQARDNQEKIEDIDKKRQRLSYLKMDTSGANSLEIYQLEEEIKDLEEDYTDTLIDQAIQDMRDANEEAQKQREEQLQIMQAQLDWDLENGSIAAEAIQMLKEAATAGTADLATLLSQAEEWGKDGEYKVHSEVTKLPEEVGTFMAGMDAYFAEGYKGEGNPEQYAKDNNVGGGGMLTTPPPETKETDNTNTTHTEKEKYGVALAIINTNQGWSKDYNDRKEQLEEKGFDPEEIQKIVTKLMKEGKVNSGAWVGAYYGIRDVREYAYTKFKTGGMADFTGPAWLDGTKQHPELVLNAQDTANFIQLKNVLSEWMASNGLSTTSQNNGDTYFDIDINVEEIGDDYSVDQLKEKIQSEILADAMYRNVNAISLSR